LAQSRTRKGTNAWSDILREQPGLQARTGGDLKDAWRNLQKWAQVERAPTHAHAALSAVGVRAALGGLPVVGAAPAAAAAAAVEAEGADGGGGA
jgi:hypothetical protein